MSKTIHTPREELVCGKLDALDELLRKSKDVESLFITRDIRHDCERMEAGLASRRDELDKANERIEELSEKYHELIMAVARKWPDETRHETALRYIQLCENSAEGTCKEGDRNESTTKTD